MGGVVLRTRALRRSGIRLLVLGTLLGLAVALVSSQIALARMRPLVRNMLENLASVDEIGQGLALEDYKRAEQAALSLRNRAKNLKKVDIELFGFDAARKELFDGFLTAQAEAAVAIAGAAKQKDPRAALAGMQRLFESACLACHREFREPAKRLRPAVQIMTGFLSSWREINRGLSVNNFSLIERHAREIENAGGVMDRDPVIEKTFGLHKAEDRKVFRSYLRQMNLQAGLIAQAAVDGDTPRVARAIREMWEGGCISCHEQFR